MRTVLFILFIGLLASCAPAKPEVKVDLPIPYVGPLTIEVIQ